MFFLLSANARREAGGDTVKVGRRDDGSMICFTSTRHDLELLFYPSVRLKQADAWYTSKPRERGAL